MTAEHDDPLHDAIALVEAAIGGDPLGCGAILRNMDTGAVAAVLGKLLAELVADNGRGQVVCCPECFRSWATVAGRRPLCGTCCCGWRRPPSSSRWSWAGHDRCGEHD